MTPLTTVLLAGATLVLVATPGPGSLMATGRAHAAGRRPALAVAAGLTLGSLIAVVAGLAACGMVLWALDDGGLGLLKLLAVVSLMWLAVRRWVADVERPVRVPASRDRSLWRALVGGLAAIKAYPEVVAFYLASALWLFELSSYSLVDVALSLGVMTAIMGGVLAGYAAREGWVRRLLANREAVRGLQLASGGVLFLAAVMLAVPNGI